MTEQPLPLTPASLVGRWYTDRAGSQGQVIAEPSPGVYLCEPSAGGQRLVGLAVMTERGWLFWDEPPA